MSFVWNDHFITKDENYDRRYGTITRKLFVRWEVADPTQFSTTEIYRAFSTFGQIESVELIKHTVDTLGLTGQNIAEVYVTFQCSISAYSAIESNSNWRIVGISENVKKAVHANTWHQPKHSNAIETIDADKCYILNLNDHCLLKLFEYFDLDNLVELSDVCQRFRTLLSTFVFPKFKNFRVSIKAYRNHVTSTLGTVRKQLLCVGPNLHELTYSSYACYDDWERVIEKIVQYSGTNLQVLKFRVRGVDKYLLHEFKPILKNIHTLDIDTLCMSSQSLDLARQLCTTLAKLKIKISNAFFVHMEMAAPWYSLQHLSIKISHWIRRGNLPEKQMQMLQSLFANIPRLMSLKIDYITNDIIENLPNVQEICICSKYLPKNLQFTQFFNLTNLTRLHLNLGFSPSFEPILSYVEALQRLRQLKLILLATMYDPRHDDLTSLSFVDVSITRDAQALYGSSEEIRIGWKQEESSFRIDIADVPTEDALLINVVTVCNPNDDTRNVNSQTEADTRNKVTQFFQRVNNFSGNLNKSQVITNDRFRQYIEVSSFY